MRVQVDGEFDQMAWMGRGPHECYGDRKRSAMLGVWRASVDDQVRGVGCMSSVGVPGLLV